MKNKTNKEKLRLWQERLAASDTAYEAERAKMDEREALYLGSRDISPLVRDTRKKKTPHVRNICAELIESQTSSSIPQPKVTARREKDELLAKLIEDMLRGELDRMPAEQINDMMERTVPIQGGAAFLLEWDNTKRTHSSVGELSIQAVHPKQIVPQDGVYTGIEDMDYIILKLPETKEYIRRRYGVDVADESEAEPEVKNTSSGSTADDLVTQYAAYYRNPSGGIGLYSWVGDTELEDLEDYQARRLSRCKVCGEPEPEDGGAVCPRCGAREWTSCAQEYEDLVEPVMRSDGTLIGGMIEKPVMVAGEDDQPILSLVAEPTRIPCYKPDIYPVILQKNVSVYGKFLGDSDIDKITDQQNTTNRIEAKIIDKLLQSGSYITLPKDTYIKADEDDMKVIRPESHADISMIGVYDLQGNIEQDLVYLSQVYEEARQIIGITDSFQGRHDATATSGKAKEFAAAQSAGRLESKRVMKDAAYASLFEAMFKFKLAYADEPRPVVSEDIHGNRQYREFNRYDFLEQDAAGEWYWNDQFLFSCDTSAPLASNREAMWQETRLNLQTGAFGDPAQLTTLILFWTKMEQLHYPGAGETRSYLEEELERQAQAEEAQKAIVQAEQMAVQQSEIRRQTTGGMSRGGGDVLNQQQPAVPQRSRETMSSGL